MLPARYGRLVSATVPPELPDHVAENRRHWDEMADQWVAAGERQWAQIEPTWGMWGIADSELALLPADMSGMRAVELGCTRIFVIQVGPHGRPDAEIRRPLDGAMLAYWLARNNRFARDLASLPDGIEAIVLPPGERPDLRYHDFSESEALIEQGYTNTAAFLEARAEEVASRVEASGWRRRLRRLRLPVGGARTTAAEAAASDPRGAIVLGDDSESDVGRLPGDLPAE